MSLWFLGILSGIWLAHALEQRIEDIEQRIRNLENA